MPQPDPHALNEEIQRFLAERQSVILATLGDEGRSHASYAPWISDGSSAIHVFVSRLARHTGNLERTGNASALFIEDESTCRNPFARRRLTLHCRATVISATDASGTRILNRFAARHGPLVDTLRQLPDFRLIRLNPESGDYVRGFGQAYQVSGADLSIIARRDPRAPTDAE